MPGFTSAFTFEGKEHSLIISVDWPLASPKGLQSKYLFTVLIDNYYLGRLERGEGGLWHLLTDPDQFNNLPFALTGDDYQALGEMIEDRLPEFV